MKRREDSQDDVRLVVTNLEEPALEEEVANEAAEANRHIDRNPGNKYVYEIDFSTAIRTARKYFSWAPRNR